MKILNNVFILSLAILSILLLISCEINTTTNTLVSSRSKEESKEREVFIGDFILQPINDDCNFEVTFNAWIEYAWKPKYFLVWESGIEKMDFYNIYIKPDPMGIKGIKVKKLNTWRNLSRVIEPPLGYTFFLESITNLGSKEFQISIGAKDCLYQIIPVGT